MEIRTELVITVESILGDFLNARVTLGQATGPVAVASSVHIVGPSGGVLVATATQSFSEVLACVLLDSDIDSLSETDTTDAMAEFANILAGNVKGRLQGEHRLTLPTVCKGGPILVPNGRQRARCTFSDTRGGTLRVELFDNAAADVLPD
jgi:CheY-specific phosphatase CheX